jgi:hypothetical protein
MKIVTSMNSGFRRSLKSWKGILIIWLFSLLLVSLIAIPMKGALKSGLGNSMITEKLAGGINAEVFADLGANFRSLGSYFWNGILMIILVGFLVNAFLAGGIFGSLREGSGGFSSGNFFRNSAKNFWPFVVILFIIRMIVLIIAILIVIIPIAVVAQNDAVPEGSVFKTAIIMGSVFLLILSFFILVADYARAWQVSRDKSAGFMAIGFGLRQTFRTFASSYILMVTLLIIQILWGLLVLALLSGFRPVTESGIILLFIFSQSLFIIKIFLKVFRYGSVTTMMEVNTNNDL